MTSINRAAGKSGDAWTQSELLALNVQIEEQECDDFFGAPLPVLSPEMASFAHTASCRDVAAADSEVYRLLRYLEIAHLNHSGSQSAKELLFISLLEKLNCVPSRKVLLPRLDLPFLTGGENKTVATALTLIDDMGWIFYFVQSDSGDGSDPEPRLIASAIAAFQQNNILRSMEIHMKPLDVNIFPAIALYGTFPVFYRIVVSRPMNEAVVTGAGINLVTRVERHTPRLPPGRYARDGMIPTDSRRVLIEYLQAFSRFVQGSGVCDQIEPTVSSSTDV